MLVLIVTLSWTKLYPLSNQLLTVVGPMYTLLAFAATTDFTICNRVLDVYTHNLMIYFEVKWQKCCVHEVQVKIWLFVNNIQNLKNLILIQTMKFIAIVYYLAQLLACKKWDFGSNEMCFLVSCTKPYDVIRSFLRNASKQSC